MSIAENNLPPRRRAAGGFTLVELLLVMFVMSVLVALVVGVGRYVIEHGRKQETIHNQDRLMAGIDAFYKAVGKYPADDPNGFGNIRVLVRQLAGDFSRVAPQGIRITEELKREIRRATQEYLSLADSEDVDGQVGTSSPYETDAWGNPMVYFDDRGLGGKPVIISAGPDGDFGERDKDKRKDNIRSDTRE